jgi:histidyl-tRNA synthetase
MPETRRFRTIRGLRDLLPSETRLWNHVERIAHEVFSTYGFSEIRLPILEAANLFEKSVGEDTDVAGKELYLWTDSPKANKGIRRVRAVAKQTGTVASIEDSPVRAHLLHQTDLGAFDTLAESDLVALRPEATASVCRAYIEHGMQSLPAPVKLYYMGPMFRRERPQKGRYRQFYQIGAEILGGTDSPAIDAEVIEMLVVYFKRLGLTDTNLSINSIGDKNCRPAYIGILQDALEKVKGQLSEDSRRRIQTNPLRVLDSKEEIDQPIIATLPRIQDNLCPDCLVHYEDVKSELKAREVPFNENWRLVRGLDYYMRTTFEITAKGLGSQNAVCGGGRYDGLVELLGGPKTNGIGFAIGEDRLVLSLQESGVLPVSKAIDVLIARSVGNECSIAAIRAARSLRDAGFRVELPPTATRIGKALGQADKLGARYALILGEDEVASGQWTVKTLADGSQAKMSEAEFLAKLKSL